jgi:phosphohistidine phosphatase SixA
MPLNQLLIVRHSKAVDSHPKGDRFRTLSDAGRGRIQELLPHVKEKAYRAELALSSPYLRARETADLFAEAVGHGQRKETHSLLPNADLRELVTELKVWEAQGIKTAVLYSHNPLVTELCQWLLLPELKTGVEFHTPSLYAIGFPAGFEPHQGELLWVLHP